MSPPVVMDTFEEPPSVPESHSVDKEKIQNTSSSSSNESSDAEGKDDGKRSSETSESIDKNKEVKEDTEIKPEKRPVAKKRSREDKIVKTVDSVVKGNTKALHSSEECFLALEEKRLKLD